MIRKTIIGLLLVCGVVFSQTAWEEQTIGGTVQYSLRVTGLDTATANAVKLSTWLDISRLDRSELISYWIKTSGDDVDTLQGSIEGKFTYGSTSVTDTLISLLPSNGEAGYTDTLNVQTGTRTDLSNFIRIRVNCPDLTSSTSTGVFFIVIRGTLVDNEFRKSY